MADRYNLRKRTKKTEPGALKEKRIAVTPEPSPESESEAAEEADEPEEQHSEAHSEARETSQPEEQSEEEPEHETGHESPQAVAPQPDPPAQLPPLPEYTFVPRRRIAGDPALLQGVARSKSPLRHRNMELGFQKHRGHPTDASIMMTNFSVIVGSPDPSDDGDDDDNSSDHDHSSDGYFSLGFGHDSDIAVSDFDYETVHEQGTQGVSCFEDDDYENEGYGMYRGGLSDVDALPDQNKRLMTGRGKFETFPTNIDPLVDSYFFYLAQSLRSLADQVFMDERNLKNLPENNRAAFVHHGVFVMASMGLQTVSGILEGTLAQLPRSPNRRQSNAFLELYNAERQRMDRARRYQPCVYVQYFGTSDCKGLPEEILRRILKLMAHYVTDAAYARRVDNAIHALDPSTHEAWETGYRRYTRQMRGRHTALQTFVDRVQLRIEDNRAPNRPLSEFGFTNNARRRLEDHAMHRNSNFILNLLEAICKVEYPHHGFRTFRYVVHKCWAPQQGWVGEILLNRIGLGYIDTGFGMSYHPAGRSTQSAGSTAAKSYEDWTKHALEWTPVRKSLDHELRIAKSEMERTIHDQRNAKEVNMIIVASEAFSTHVGQIQASRTDQNVILGQQPTHNARPLFDRGRPPLISNLVGSPNPVAPVEPPSHGVSRSLNPDDDIHTMTVAILHRVPHQALPQVDQVLVQAAILHRVPHQVAILPQALPQALPQVDQALADAAILQQALPQAFPQVDQVLAQATILHHSLHRAKVVPGVLALVPEAVLHRIEASS
ncbi:hypothetical protein IWZ03DRAFT_359428 [Phyllosticta citriasiana]|uniref:Uncharacterized protein n=1 Tax=Phyllosticta citriasiana TaxID=595635 RepID=A0ABR1KLC1_9PEZI